MKNNQVFIYDHNTGKSVCRDLTPDEQTERNADTAQAEIDRAAKEAKDAETAAAKAALLDRLGITADEAKLLLG